jgi:hypothetical protein
MECPTEEIRFIRYPVKEPRVIKNTPKMTAQSAFLLANFQDYSVAQIASKVKTMG